MTIHDQIRALRGALTDPGTQHPVYAVVIPVVWGPAGAELLLEVRATGIPQAGDPCFPGGKIEKGESPALAAAREMEEELGIRVDPGDFLGSLPTVHTPLGLRTAVFVCQVPPAAAEALRPSPAEVDVTLRVPVSFFLRRPGAPDFTVDGHVIWGMTAGAIRHLCAAWRRAGLPEA